LKNSSPERDFKSPLTPSAIAYTFRQLADRAGVTGGDPEGSGFETLDVSIAYSPLHESQALGADIVIVPCADEAWHNLIELPALSLDWLEAEEVGPRGACFPFAEAVPVLFWGKGFENRDRPFAELRDDGTVVFYADIIATVFFMLSRWEETVIPVADEHERFPGSSSLSYRQGFLERPIVDEYGLVFREWLKAVLPDWEPKRRSFMVKLSHDIDSIRRFSDWSVALRTFSADLIKRRSPRQALQTATAAAMPRRDPFFLGIHHLVEISKDAGLGSGTVNFLVDETEAYGGGYDIGSPLIRQCIDDLRHRGYTIGLHASYKSLNDPERLAQEKATLDAILGESTYGGRQHFIRFKVPDTWWHWQQVGLACDATMMYADQPGFRCGTCHPFRPYDLIRDHEFSLWEEPLVVMDTSLAHYRGFSPSQGESLILELAERCKRVEGIFTLLWHNYSYDDAWGPTGDTYRRVVKQLAELE
jgi:hypothetical protein